MRKRKVLVVFGTRPEAIKMCPLVKELKKREKIECIVCVTAQHREMLDQILSVFKITPEYDLDIMEESQTLSGITTKILCGMESILDKVQPDIVLVHGDTTTSFVAALAAFYKKIPVGHVEAGLRSYNKYEPFPEEMNRCLTGQLSDIHFAPTKENKENLLAEAVKGPIYVTGNTVIDSFKTTVKDNYHFKNSSLENLDFNKKKVILVTAHRRENIGKPLEEICLGINKIVEQYEEVIVIYPVHKNPLVRKTVFEYLGEKERILLLEPLDVIELHNLMARCYLVITDSGGLQEEAPHFGVPVLVARNQTERTEALKEGTIQLVGNSKERIYEQAVQLIENESVYKKMAKATNPYGDGHASEKIAYKLMTWFER